MSARSWAPGPMLTRRRLGGELRRLREAMGLKLEDVARRLECSPSKISRLETGQGIPKYRDVRDILDVLGTDGAERDRLLDWSRNGRAKMWWHQYGDVLPPVMSTYVELEWDAARILAYEAHLVHGLLQTRDYARAVLLNAYGESLRGDSIERLVEVRMRRQEALTADQGLVFTCVLDESTIHRVVGSPTIQRRQVEHLLGLAEAEHVDLRIVPFGAGLLPSSRDSFSWLEFPEGMGMDLVYIEHPGSAGEFVTDPDDVARRRDRLVRLRDAALTERESVPLLETSARRLLAT